MTLIITSLAEDALIQVSDRKLTYPNGSVASNFADKAIYVNCTDARFTVAYTGLARVGNTQTDHWLLNYLTNSRAANKRFPKIIEELRLHAANTFRSLGNHRGITFVFAGFGPPGPFAVLLSNQENGNGQWIGSINDSFDVGWFLRNASPMLKLDVIINGAEAAITPELTTAIRKIRRRFLRLSPEQRVTVFVDVLRRASHNPNYGRLIGRDCMSTILNVADGLSTQFYPENESPLSYTPHYVNSQFSMRDIWVSTDPQRRPPWTP